MSTRRTGGFRSRLWRVGVIFAIGPVLAGACNLADPVIPPFQNGPDGGDTRVPRADTRLDETGAPDTDDRIRDAADSGPQIDGYGENDTAGTDDDPDTTTKDGGDLDAADACAGQESCNGVDDDCDGVVDEGCACTFDPDEADQIDTDGSHDQGVCRQGTLQSSGDCAEPAEFEPTETKCADGKDNDCDGSTDFTDADCKKDPGASCSGDGECLGLCEPFSGASGDVCTHRIFVTSKRWNGDLGGLQGADQKCNRLAASENLGGTWRAVVSTPNVDAEDHVTLKGALFNLDGTRIANDADDLWDGSLDAPVRRDETNSTLETLVWSGSEANGTWDGSDGEDVPDDCGGGWVSKDASDAGEVGHSDLSDDKWLRDAKGIGERDCDKEAALYCVDRP